MSRINHNRPILKLIDDAKRARCKCEGIPPVSALIADLRDPETPPDVSKRLSRALSLVSKYLIQRAQGVSASEQIDRAKTKGLVPSEKYRRRAALGIEAQALLVEQLISLTIYVTYHQDKQTKAVDGWISWWFGKMRREGRNIPRIESIFNEALDEASIVVKAKLLEMKEHKTPD